METQTTKYKNASANTLRFDADGKEHSVAPGATVSLSDSPYVAGLVGRKVLAEVPVAKAKEIALDLPTGNAPVVPTSDPVKDATKVADPAPRAGRS